MSLLEIPFPVMQLAQLRFQFSRQETKVKQEMLNIITQNSMTPFYLQLASEFKDKWENNAKLVGEMSASNEQDLKKLNDKLEDAEKNLGETEIFDALVAVATFYCRIADKEKSISFLRKAFEKAIGSGMKLDLVFAQLRIGLFFQDFDLIQSTLDKAQALIDEGGDWDRRNRLKVYRGIYLLSIRKFKEATPLLLDGLATFSSAELMEYKQFVKYTVLAAVLTVQRQELKKKVLESPEILEVLHEIPHLEQYILSLYTCKYGQFFHSLASIEEYLKNDLYLHQHYNWYTREMRILAYKQVLESYQSLSMESMAKYFGVSQEFIDRDLSKFISAGRLNCVIDKVAGLIETNRPDSKNAQYQQCIKQGDALLNRIQKLGRVINV